MGKPKGQKNTKNKAKHTKLLNQKMQRIKNQKILRKERLLEISRMKANQKTLTDFE